MVPPVPGRSGYVQLLSDGCAREMDHPLRKVGQTEEVKLAGIRSNTADKPVFSLPFLFSPPMKYQVVTFAQCGSVGHRFWKLPYSFPSPLRVVEVQSVNFLVILLDVLLLS